MMADIDEEINKCIEKSLDYLSQIGKFVVRGRFLARAVLMCYIYFLLNFVNLTRALYKLSNLVFICYRSTHRLEVWAKNMNPTFVAWKRCDSNFTYWIWKKHDIYRVYFGKGFVGVALLTMTEKYKTVIKLTSFATLQTC